MGLPLNFDPRTVPYHMVDHHLPAIPPDRLGSQALIRRFSEPPNWHPEFQIEPRFSDRSLTPASVLIGLVMHERPTVLLTQRTQHLTSHSGQIAFPGGKADPGDGDPVVTALREAQEEVGLDPRCAQVIGSLPQYTTGSGFVVTPVVALLNPGLSLLANAYEVDDIFEVPLDFVMNPLHHRRHTMSTADGSRQWLSMPYQDGTQERFIWGATAGMLRNFYQFLAID